uniref:N-acetyltransferase domain-containing protein n=1 Tax=Anopheles maculatus TaxID=74869 RepID=A0A182SYU5_9DIPT
MLRWIRKFRWSSLLSDLKSSPGASQPTPAANNDAARFDIKDSRLQNTLSAIRSCPCRVRLARAADTGEVVAFVQRNLLHHEPLLRALNVGEIPGREQWLDYVRQLLRDSFTLVALADDGSDRSPNGRIVGVAISRRSCSWDGKQLIERADRTRCDQLRKLLYIWSIVESEPALHQHFCTRCLFEIAFLATSVELQRQGIGLHLTLHSLQLARDLGFHFARMNCTCEYSSRVASKAGLECCWTVAYHHLVDSSKQPVVQPAPPHTHIKVHAMALFPELSIKSSCSACLTTIHPTVGTVSSRDEDE